MSYLDHKANRAMADKAEAAGQVADNMDYRKALMAKVYSGDITLEQAQKELAATKRNAKKNGQVTRSQAYKGY